MTLPDHITPLPDEPRATFLLRVAAFYIREHCPDQTIRYDGAVCDGYCIAEECEVEADGPREHDE